MNYEFQETILRLLDNVNTREQPTYGLQVSGVTITTTRINFHYPEPMDWNPCQNLEGILMVGYSVTSPSWEESANLTFDFIVTKWYQALGRFNDAIDVDWTIVHHTKENMQVFVAEERPPLSNI